MRDLFKKTDGVVDVDGYVEDDQPKYRLIVDEQKAALNGISNDAIARAMQGAAAGYQAGLLHQDAEDVPLTVRLDRPTRSDPERAFKTWGSRAAAAAWSCSASWFTSKKSWKTRASTTRI